MSYSAERPTKRLRRLSSEYDDSDAIEDWMPVKKPPADVHDGRDDSAIIDDTTSRSRRSLRDPPASTMSKQAEDGIAKSIKFTVKPPAGRVQEAMNGSSKPGSTTKASSELGETVSGPRGTRAKRPIIDESESEEDEEEEDEDDDEEGVDDDDDDDDDEDQEESEEDEEEDEEDEEEEDENEEVEAKETPVPVVTAPARAPAPAPLRDANGRFQRRGKGNAPPPKGRVQVLAQSKTKTTPNRRGSAGTSGRARKADEDDDGDDQVDEEDEDDSDEIDDDESTPGSDSRASTPDISKMTKRQRSRLEASIDGDLLQLPDEVKAKKILSAEEHAMRRAEMARRRKNLSEKRKEEEKMDTINKLLKKQAPKQRRSRLAEVMDDSTPNVQDAEPAKANSVFVRWISSAKGCVVAVPEEWLDAPVGRVFQGSIPKQKMVEEVVERVVEAVVEKPTEKVEVSA